MRHALLRELQAELEGVLAIQVEPRAGAQALGPAARLQHRQHAARTLMPQQVADVFEWLGGIMRARRGQREQQRELAQLLLGADAHLQR